MDKIQIIEKLFTFILVHSYLLLPILFIFSKSKKSQAIIILALYGLIFYFLLQYFYDIPIKYRKIQQASYTFLEYSVFTYLFWYSIQNQKIRKFIVLSYFLFFAFHLCYYLFATIQKMDSVPIAVETIFMFIYAFLFFRQFFKFNLNLNIYEYSSFWLVVGILLYLGTSFFLNILYNHLTKEQIEQFWHYSYIPEIVKNILFALVILGKPFKTINPVKVKPVEIPNLDMI